MLGAGNRKGIEKLRTVAPDRLRKLELVKDSGASGLIAIHKFHSVCSITRVRGVLE